ncbi:MAG TPA: ion channel [Polyangiaceae bacterium]|jgi:inward rectifier potassium channel
MSEQRTSEPMARAALPRTVVALGVVRFESKNLERRWFADVYHFMMGISWAVLLGLFFLVYIATNALFAGLYLFGDGGIEHARSGSFADAFWFSVQTFATIGYGGMAPATPYAHVLVTLEAFIGMMSIALGTGIVFAKFSRPRALIKFSKKMVVHVRNGRRVLEFRLANQRRSSLSDTGMKLNLVYDEVTSEGLPMRRSLPLELERAHMPLMALAWNVIHVLDERSPLHGLTSETATQRMVGIIAMLSAHDETMAETVRARQFYQAQDLAFDCRFVDMISRGENDVIVIDHGLLDELRPLGALSSPAELPVVTSQDG